ncbi:MAG: HAD family phosphatase [candidate division WOR-3 bacterium]
MNFLGFGAIFDYDGVIVDTEPIYLLAMQEMAKKRGKDFTLETKREVMGTGGLLSMKIMKERLSLKENPEELLKERSEIYGRLLSRFGIAPRPGLFFALTLFKKMGFEKAIASSSQRKWIEMGLKSLGIENEFKVIVSGEEVKEAKPAPEIFLLASSRLGIDKEKCLVLEDTLPGVKAAKGARMRCIAIPNQYNQDEDFSLADRKISSLLEITEEMIREIFL